MSKRFDVCSPRPRKDSEKPYWHKVGTAWQSERGINVVFDSLPLPDKEGRVSVALFEPREKTEPAPQQSTRPVSKDELGDQEIPF